MQALVQCRFLWLWLPMLQKVSFNVIVRIATILKELFISVGVYKFVIFLLALWYQWNFWHFFLNFCIFLLFGLYTFSILCINLSGSYKTPNSKSIIVSKNGLKKFQEWIINAKTEVSCIFLSRYLLYCSIYTFVSQLR